MDAAWRADQKVCGESDQVVSSIGVAIDSGIVLD